MQRFFGTYIHHVRKTRSGLGSQYFYRGISSHLPGVSVNESSLEHGQTHEGVRSDEVFSVRFNTLEGVQNVPINETFLENGGSQRYVLTTQEYTNLMINKLNSSADFFEKESNYDEHETISDIVGKKPDDTSNSAVRAVISRSNSALRPNVKSQEKLKIGEKLKEWQLRSGLKYTRKMLQSAERALNEYLLRRADQIGLGFTTSNFRDVWSEIVESDKVYPLRISLRGYGALLESINLVADRRYDNVIEKIYLRSKQHVLPQGDPNLRNIIYVQCMVGAARAKKSVLARRLFMDTEDARELGSFVPNNFFISDMILAFASAGDYTSALNGYSLLKKLKFQGTEAMWPPLLLIMAKHEIRRVIRTMDAMLANQFFPSVELIGQLVHEALKQGASGACTKLIRAGMALGSGFSLSEPVVQELFEVAAKNGDTALANELYGILPNLSPPISPTAHFLNCIACAFANSQKPKDAMDALLQISSLGLKVELKTINTIAKAIEKKRLDIDDIYYDLAERKLGGSYIPIEAVNAVLAACARGSHVDSAFETAEAIEKVFGLQKDIVSFNLLLRATASMVNLKRATDVRAATGLSILSDLKAQGLLPNEETYFHLIQLIALSGTPKDMKLVLKEMEEMGIEPGVPILRVIIPFYTAQEMHEEVLRYTEQLENLLPAAQKISNIREK